MFEFPGLPREMSDLIDQYVVGQYKVEHKKRFIHTVDEIKEKIYKIRAHDERFSHADWGSWHLILKKLNIHLGDAFYNIVSNKERRCCFYFPDQYIGVVHNINGYQFNIRSILPREFSIIIRIDALEKNKKRRIKIENEEANKLATINILSKIHKIKKEVKRYKKNRKEKRQYNY